MPDLLPPEIWSQIFDLAADEDILFHPGIPTAMAESAWYKDIIINEWRLRSPREAMNILQRRSYATKKVYSRFVRNSIRLIYICSLGNNLHVSPMAGSRI
jgi:hypothetical protein